MKHRARNRHRYLHLENEQSTLDEDGFLRIGCLARRVAGGYLVVSAAAGI